MQKKIIIFIIILFIASSVWLFYQSDKQTNPNLNKNWWAISFVDPKSNNLDFIIENHSDQTDFHWEISDGGNKLKEGDAKIEKGAQSEINPEINSENISQRLTRLGREKITIQVSIGDEKKEIYKNFDK